MTQRVLLLLLGALVVCAQPKQENGVSKAIADFAKLNQGEFTDQDEIDRFAQEYIKERILVEASKSAIEARLEFRRADVQTGSTSGASGSTSSILDPLLPAVFGFAFENGGITRSVSGNTITLKANPAGIFCASGEDAAATARRSQDACKTHWKKVGITASFDTSRGEKKKELDGLQTINSQFTELTVRGEIFNWRTLTGEQFDKHFRDQLNPAAVTLVNTMALVMGPIQSRFSPGVAERIKATVEANDYRSASEEAKKTALRTALAGALPEGFEEEVAELSRTGALQDLHDDWADALAAYRKQQNAVLNAPMLTAEYSYQQPDLATAATANSIVTAGVRPPNLHTGRLIYAQGIADKRIDLTANASASFFDDTRPGMSRAFRDFRAGGQATIRLRDVPGYGAPSLHLAFLYTYLHQQPLGLGIVAFNQAQIKEKGHIRLFQAKLEFPTANNAVRIPISFTASNRTELIKESDVRGQIGISFNLDQLFAQPAR